MNEADLAWETFEFHCYNVTSLENTHIQNVAKFSMIRDGKFHGSKSEACNFLNSMLSCLDKLIATYNKQIISIKEIVLLNKSDREILKKRGVQLHSLHTLLNTVSTLSEEMNKFKGEVKRFKLDFLI